MLPNKSSYSELGGELTDYSPVTDPETDLSADASNEARADTAAMTRTAIRAWVTLSCLSDVITIANTDYDAVYGIALIYKPTITYIDVGVYEITFPETVLDARNVTQTVNFNGGWANFASTQGANILGASVEKMSANVIRVYLYNISSGTLANVSSGRINVFVL